MRDQLQRAVLALAQPPEVQLRLFPDFVCKADELALDFEDGLYELVGHEDEIDQGQRAAIDALDGLLIGMSGRANASFWTEDALRSHPIWDEIRDAAKAVAEAFGWAIQNPGPSGAIYIRAGK
ncbi:MAG TPA: hypothetical protein VEX35_04625 [Allosphingosinicella sp.]|nr:hypothetical protein [Allosphingosinicella sp.]